MKIVVLAAGTSSEREVSIVSGTQVCKALRSRGHRAILLDLFFGWPDASEDAFSEAYDVDAAAERLHALTAEVQAEQERRRELPGPHVLDLCTEADIVFMALHGANGEDGRMQALLDLYGVRYTGPDYLSSALAMDKERTKQLFRIAGVPTPKGVLVTAHGKIRTAAELGMQYPLVVKPCSGGSSLGVSIVHDDQEFREALRCSFALEPTALVEEYIRGREFSVAVVAGEAYPIIEIAPKQGFYDYRNKYEAGSTVETCPADLPADITGQMQKYSIMAADVLGIRTYVRFDFMMRENGEMFCLEANTLPGMTPTSLVPQEAAAIGLDFPSLCERLIEVSMERYRQYESDDIPVPAEQDSREEEKETGEKLKLNRVRPMKGLTVRSAAAAVKGSIWKYTAELGWTETEDVSDVPFSSVVTDSRQVEEGALFAAIRGQRVDGHRFIPQCARAGAAGILCETLPEDGIAVPVILTDDTLRALRDLAEYYLSVLQIPTVGIVGSVGKTTTKEVTASVLGRGFRVLKTEGNFNNELGVPLTVFRLREGDELAVLEMGINHFGEMSRLARIVRPRAVVMTNIGFSHIEFLGSQEGILKAKAEVFDYLAEDGCAVLNADDPLLASLAARTGFRKIFYGIGQGIGGPARQIWADRLEPLGLSGTRCVIHTPDSEFPVMIPHPGQHMVSNVLAAAACGWLFGLSEQQIAEGISQMETLSGRFHLIETGDLTIIDDCYNASPASMEAALSLLRKASGRRIAVLGDMGELGGEGPRLHAEVGAFAAGEGCCDALYCIGEASRALADAAAGENPSLSVNWFPDRTSLIDSAEKLFLRGDTVLVKASHFMQFQTIVEALKEMQF